jgi:hypothetical protein
VRPCRILDIAPGNAKNKEVMTSFSVVIGESGFLDLLQEPNASQAMTFPPVGHDLVRLDLIHEACVRASFVGMIGAECARDSSARIGLAGLAEGFGEAARGSWPAF